MTGDEASPPPDETPDVSRAKAPTWEERMAARPAALARARMILAACPPYRRERPRGPDEAALLRSFGTPEHLIGPDCERG